MDLVFATHNTHKTQELQKILGSTYSLQDLNKLHWMLPIEETGKNFEENALIKAQAVYDVTNMPVLAEDSGLVVPALDGAPGIYSARYSTSGESEDNIRKLLGNMQNITDRTAFFVCVFAFVAHDEIRYFSGKTQGTIAHTLMGKQGFGYDPIFIPDGYDGHTFAEIDLDTKNLISHRAKAASELKTFLDQFFRK